MGLNLEKGTVLNLSKDPGVNLKKGVVFGLGFAANSGSVDLDSWISVQDKSGKVIEFICYYSLIGTGVKHNGDDTSGGGRADKPNETIEINFSKLPSNAHKLIAGNSIFSGASNLGGLKYAFTTITQNGNEVARFNMKDEYSNFQTVIVGEFRKSEGEWKFKALGKGEKGKFSNAKVSYGTLDQTATPGSGGGLLSRLGRGLFGG